MKGPAVHISLRTSNLEASRRFYGTFFGIEPAKVRPGYVKFVAPSPEIHLALEAAEGATSEGSTLSHLGIRVGDLAEVDRWRDRAKRARMALSEEKNTTCCFARQHKFWVSDPDGNRWEVYTVVEDVA